MQCFRCKPMKSRWKTKRKKYKDAKDRILSSIVPDLDTGCWNWAMGRDTAGYGHFSWKGRFQRSSRFAWEAFIGPIPDGQWVLHKCDNRACCNPKHLFLGDAVDNMVDMTRKMRRRGGVSVKKNGDCSARLNEARVLEIRQLSREKTVAEIARIFGLRYGHCWAVIARKTWKHIP